MSMSVNNVLSTYTYQFGSTTRPNLDTDVNGSWSKAEVQSYASDYSSATGEDLDVAAIFEKYDANNDGRLVYSEYKNIISDDALHIGKLNSMKSSEPADASANAADKTQPSDKTAVDKTLANDVLSKYTYQFGSTTRPNLDTDVNGFWSKDEVGSYVADYNAATGGELDADAIFEKYDANGDGRLGYSEYKDIISDDALNIGNLTSIRDSASVNATDKTDTTNKTTDKTTGKTTESSSSNWLSKLSTRQKVSLVRSTWKAETTGNFLNAMLSTNNNLFSMFSMRNNSFMSGNNIFSALQSYNSTKYYSTISSIASRLNTTM